jgi:ArsR family transcriptional regulator
LFKAGVVSKRRDGVQVFYRIANERVVQVCKAVCSQVEDRSFDD